MISPRSTVKLKIDGVKYRAVVTSVRQEVETVDVSPDGARHWLVPGRAVVMVTLMVEEIVP